MKSGDTFMIEDASGAKEHLQVVLTDPDTRGEVITVCICTQRPYLEALITLKKGDHPFLKHASVVAYQWSEIRNSSVIRLAVKNGLAREEAPIDQDLLKRLRSGLMDSDFTPNGVRSFFKDSGTSY